MVFNGIMVKFVLWVRGMRQRILMDTTMSISFLLQEIVDQKVIPLNGVARITWFANIDIW